MSREVLLKVASSPIELADATAIQTSPMTTEGAAGRSADHTITGNRPIGASGGCPAERSSATGVAGVDWRAMVVGRRRRMVSQTSSRARQSERGWRRFPWKAMGPAIRPSRPGDLNVR